MKTAAMILALMALTLFSVAYAQESIDSIEKEVLAPNSGQNTPTRNCVTRAHEAEALYTANGYVWRERTHEVYGIRDGEIGGSHMCVDVKIPTNPLYQIMGLEDAGNGMCWLPTLDVMPMQAT